MKKIFGIAAAVAALAACAAGQQADFVALKARAESGDVQSEVALAKAYESGEGVRANRFMAADWYKKAAEAGNAEAQNITGVLLRTGEGGRKDEVEALKWFRMAAKRGYADAMFNVGTAYYNGNGTEINDQLAFAWFICAQAAGSKPATDAVERAMGELHGVRFQEGMLNGAAMLIAGKDVPANVPAAVPWLKRLVDSGVVAALIPLARLSMEGRFVPKDQTHARELCEEGAKAKLPAAMACLGMIYRNGLGVREDPTVAANWYRKGAECGDANSIYILSQMYGKGEGVKQDPFQQYVLLQVVSPISPEARSEAEALQAQFDPKTLTKAEKKAAEFLAKTRMSNCLSSREPANGLRIRH